MARKRKSKPTTAKRSSKQRVKDRYAHAREDAQLLGLIPTMPEEALKGERVDPSTQGEQVIVSIPLRAASEGWATPAAKKVRVVDELVGLVEAPMQGPETPDGVSPLVKVMAANALGKLDQIQHERDHPQQKAGTEVNVNVINQNLWQPIFQASGQVPDEIEERLRIEGQVEQSGAGE